MMKRSTAAICVALSVAAGCGGSPVRTVSGPAPAGALTCALQQAAQLGYRPIRGGVADGYVVLERPRENDAGRVAAIVPGVRSPTDGDELTITQTANGLQIAANAYYQRHGFDRRLAKPSRAAIKHSDTILVACGTR
jgi:hypothetical protein